jgi:hypothetical protein
MLDLVKHPNMQLPSKYTVKMRQVSLLLLIYLLVNVLLMDSLLVFVSGNSK